MFGPVSKQNRVRGRVQIKIVGHEALAASGHLLLLDHGMAALDDLQIRPHLLRRRFFWRSNELRSAVIPQRRDVRQRGQHIDLSQAPAQSDEFALPRTQSQSAAR